MGPGFAPYLPVVMGPIMKTASMKPEVALLDNDELNGVENDSEDWQFVSLGEQQNFGIKTAGEWLYLKVIPLVWSVEYPTLVIVSKEKLNTNENSFQVLRIKLQHAKC